MKVTFRFEIGARVVLPSGLLATVLANYTDGGTNRVQVEYRAGDKIDSAYYDERLLAKVE